MRVPLNAWMCSGRAWGVNVRPEGEIYTARFTATKPTFDAIGDMIA